MAKKTSVNMSLPLTKLKEKTLEDNVPFSGRVSDIVERYEAVVANTVAPEVSDEEVSILSEVFMGSVLTATKLKYLHEEILECVSGTEESRQKLSERVQTWSPIEKVMFLETNKV